MPTDVFARREIDRVVHCHADHFEPEAVAKRYGASADVALWFARCAPAIPTLFVKPPIGYHIDAGAALGVVLRPGSTAAIEAGYLRSLAELGAGVGLHVHHEAWTTNQLPREKMTSGQVVLHDYVLAQNDQRSDLARMRSMVEASLAWLREVTGAPLETWHFVHGCWALGASDPEICQLRDELPLLYSLGCRADFSFPAGRRTCDPAWERPKWVRPVSGVRSYELPSADARDAPADDRMLVWASRTAAWWLCIDTYTDDSRKLTESADKVVRHLEVCPVVDRVAYVKTCSHGMNPHYWQEEGEPRPTLGAFARELVAACRPVPVEFLSTDQAVDRLRAAAR